jgi:hypothetical protein
MRVCLRHLWLPTLLLCLPPAAHADEGESLVSLAVVGAGLSLSAFQDGTASPVLFGAVAGYTWMPADAWALGGELTYVTGRDVHFEDVTVAGVGGAGYQAFAHVHELEAVLTGRLVADRWLWRGFAGTHPFLGLRTGLASEWFSSIDVGTAGGRMVASGTSELRWRPLVGADVGVTWPLGDRFELRGAVTASAAEDRQMMGLQIGVGWAHTRSR